MFNLAFESERSCSSPQTLYWLGWCTQFQLVCAFCILRSTVNTPTTTVDNTMSTEYFLPKSFAHNSYKVAWVQNAVVYIFKLVHCMHTYLNRERRFHLRAAETYGSCVRLMIFHLWSKKWKIFLLFYSLLLFYWTCIWASDFYKRSYACLIRYKNWPRSFHKVSITSECFVWLSDPI